MRFLGIDAGGTATRWAVCDARGVAIGTGELQPASGHLFNLAERDRFEDMVTALGEAVGAPIAGVVAGLTGLTAGAPEAATATTILAERLEIPAAFVQVHDDMWIGYHAAFRRGAGHVVYAGTGSVGTHVRADGEVIRVGGRGMLIDDGGSAFWIGQAALKLIWRRIDDAADAGGALADAIFAAIGGSSWDTVRAFVYGGGRAHVASLARAVAAAAADPDALMILHAAGGELARLAQALVRRAGAKPVALLGRAAALHPEILTGFRAAAPTLEVRLAAPNAALAAARLAAAAAAGHAEIDTLGE